MSKYTTIIFMSAITIFLLFLPKSVAGQTTTPSPTASPSPTGIIGSLENNLEKIKLLKDKVATKVAEIRSNEKKAFFGKVTALGKDDLTLDLGKSETITVKPSEDTNYYTLDQNGDRNDSSKSKLKEGTPLSVFGYFDLGNKQIDAKYIYIGPIPLHLVGKITDLDRKNFTVSIKTMSQDDWTIDIETFTKTLTISKGSLQKGGFSKLSPGDLVHITGQVNSKEKNRASALRILVLSDLTVSNPASPSATPKI